MKKIILFSLSALTLLATSCSNEEILIEKDNNVNVVDVNVSLSDFFSCYTYNDTKHGISVAEDFRTFHSDYDYYIHVRTLFYNDRGNLVDSIISFVNTTNAISKSVKLAEGEYTVITTLNFALDDSNEESLWDLCDKEKLSTVYLQCAFSQTQFSIMSYTSKSISVSSENKTDVKMTPEPIGALGYMVIENFQYKSKTSSSTIADNGVREVAFYCQDKAIGYKLDPNATDKYMYKDATGSNTWYYLYSFEPSDFDWKYFQNNCYGYFYILNPKMKAVFGYELEGDTGFNPYGEGSYSINNGQTYLAYWNWFKVGNPYFGKADNNHWN